MTPRTTSRKRHPPKNRRKKSLSKRRPLRTRNLSKSRFLTLRLRPTRSRSSDGAAIIKTSDLNEVKAILAKALIANYDPEKDYSELEWEYECKGTGVFGKLSNTDWGSIAGFTSTKLRVNYTHPALWDNADGTYRVRLADNTDVVVGFYQGN